MLLNRQNIATVLKRGYGAFVRVWIALILMAGVPVYANGWPDSRVIVSLNASDYSRLVGKRASRSRGDDSSVYQDFIRYLEESYDLRHVDDWDLNSLDETMLLFDAHSDQAAIRATEHLAQQHKIKFVQRVGRFRVAARRNTPVIDAEPLTSLQENLSLLGVTQAHRWATGAGIRVAIIDTGVDRQHSDLHERIEHSADFSGAPRRDFDTDIHGTVVASIIAGARDGNGMLGIAPDAKIIALKACIEPNRGSRYAACDSITIARALDHAISQSPDVINLSLTGPDDPLLRRLITAAISRNIVVIGAASVDTLSPFPSGIPGVLSAAIAPAGEGTSNSGDVLLAPNDLALAATPGGDHDYFSGDSVASAELSGVVALLLQRKPHLSADMISYLLRSTSDSDSGYFNACESLARIVGAPCEAARTTQ